MWKKQFEDELLDIRKRLEVLEQYSHPPQEFICCRRCGCKINKTKSKIKEK